MKAFQIGKGQGIIAIAAMRVRILATPLCIGFLLVVMLWLVDAPQPLGMLQLALGS